MFWRADLLQKKGVCVIFRMLGLLWWCGRVKDNGGRVKLCEEHLGGCYIQKTELLLPALCTNWSVLNMHENMNTLNLHDVLKVVSKNCKY